MCSAKTSSNHVTLLATNPAQSVLAEVGEARVKPLAYTAYGVQSGEQSAGSHLGFNGQLRERPLGWYHLGHGRRIYSPVLMHFFSPDTLSPFEDGGLNPYGYCVGDPINLGDPTGQAPDTVQTLGLIAAGVGLFAGLFTFAAPRLLAAGKPGSWAHKVAQSQPGMATAPGGLDAVNAFAGIAGGVLGGAATILNLQEEPMGGSEEVMKAGLFLGLGSVVTKLALATVPTIYRAGSTSRKVGVFLHGKKKILNAEKTDAALKAQEQRSSTPIIGSSGSGGGVEMNVVNRSSSSLSSIAPPPSLAPPGSPPPLPLHPMALRPPLPLPRTQRMQPRVPRTASMNRRLRGLEESEV